MSLINDALKKAQRQRNEEPIDPAAVAAGSGTAAGVRIAKRSKAPTANMMVLVGSGAIVLVVLSVVVTVYLLNRPAAGTPPAAQTASTPASPANPAPKTSTTGTESSAPGIVAPVPSAPSPVAPAETNPVPASPVVSTPGANAAPSGTNINSAPLSEPGTTPPAPATASVAPATPSGPVAKSPDERVAAFVEAIRVTGIRSSGTDSRVLMNERVYRVNDIVERTLGVRLIKVANDSLTFSDPNGVTYEKHF